MHPLFLYFCNLLVEKPEPALKFAEGEFQRPDLKANLETDITEDIVCFQADGIPEHPVLLVSKECDQVVEDIGKAALLPRQRITGLFCLQSSPCRDGKDPRAGIDTCIAGQRRLVECKCRLPFRSGQVVHLVQDKE